VAVQCLKLAFAVVFVVTSLPFTAAAQSAASSPKNVDYLAEVRPVLAQHCYSCHGPNAQQSGLRLDLRQNALRGGDYGPVIVPGNSRESKLVRRLVDGDGGMQMPPAGALESGEIDVLRAWIDQGAEFVTSIEDDVPVRQTDPKVARLLGVVSEQSAAAVREALRENPALVNATDDFASTPLHYAAAYGSLETMTWLLDNGASVNAKNRRAATPLYWAVHDDAKVRLLLARGAAVNVKQVDGRTPLFQAATLGNGEAALRLLLEHGADPSIATANGQTPLMAAAARGDATKLRLLLDKSAPVNAKNGAGETALFFAATDGNPEAVALLLERGADPKVRSKRTETALGNAATSGNERTVQMLLDRGAEVNVQNIRGYSPLMLAASSDTIPAGVVKLLLARGAKTDFTGDYEETARDFAAKRGDTEVARLLGVTAPAPSPAPAASHAVRRDISSAVSRALTMLEKQSANFIRISGCNSCHSQDLPSALAGFARQRGVGRSVHIEQLPTAMVTRPERVIDLNVVNVASLAWETFDMGMNGLPADPYTDAAIHYFVAMQSPAGNWSTNEGRRPPMNAGEYQAAALAIYSLRHYGKDNARAPQTIAKAVAWLERMAPESTQDRAFRAMAFAWASPGSDSAKAAARALLSLQRSDGGWSQLPTLESDAYATGQALYALNIAAGMSTSDPAFRKGVDYLLNTQAEDGTWHVKTRSIWLQPYLESGFPYGRDQFISTAGTAWAAMALTAAAPGARSTIAR
jgi:ankyrin repeat protein